jgi:putative spermidine/putrescine transport system ATP-binding protein
MPTVGATALSLPELKISAACLFSMRERVIRWGFACLPQVPIDGGVMADGAEPKSEPASAALRLAGHSVDLESVTHRYTTSLAVDDVTLNIRAGEVMALLGPSGCGKTTLLRVIAGFVRQQAGRVLIDGRSIDDLPPNLRNIGIVFQSYALFPHMTVAENVAYGLKARGRSAAEIGPRVGQLIDVVRLGGLADRLPRQLSGGQQQRVALARVLAIEPTVILLDEPFSALDKSLRLDMQIEIKRLQRQFGLTAILVTHDQDEAMGIADRVAVMNKGAIEQCDSPVEVYDRPSSLFVSGFIGTMNQFAGRVAATDTTAVRLDLDAGGKLAGACRVTLAPGQGAIAAVRPEQLMLHERAGDGLIPVRHRLAMPMGPQTIHELETADNRTIKVIEPRVGAPRQPGAEVWLGLRPGAVVTVFPIQ